LTERPGGARHDARHLRFQPVNFEESDMSKYEGFGSVRKTVEKAFAAVASAAILMSVGTVTVAMCFPGLGVA
jgi:hypothetical protein